MTKWTCSEPWNTAYLEQTSSGLKVSPCCVGLYQDYNPEFGLYDQPYLKQIRDEFEKGVIPSACRWCERNENNGFSSKRKQEHLQHKVVNLEIHVGNYCNLKCVICNNSWSSAWRKDAQALGLETYDNFKLDPDNLDVDWKSVRWLHFNGGEPLFTDVHKDIIQKIPDPSVVEIYYNTNGTIRAKDSLFDIWRKFKLVKLVFSIDDIGDRFDYQRTNAKWSEVESNLLWYRDTAPSNMMFGINRTVSRLNKEHLNDLDKWVDVNFSTNRLGDANDFTEQLAIGPTALDASDHEFEDYISRLDQVRY